MTDSYDELLRIAQDLEQLAVQGRSEEIWQPLERLKQAAENAHQAWSGSWLGYHANVYYKDIQPPPPGAHFSKEWGGTKGDWAEYDPEGVKEVIHQRAGNPNLSPVIKFNENAKVEFARQKSNLLSIIEIESRYSESQFLTEQKETITNLSFTSEEWTIQNWMPNQSTSRDNRAIYQGHWIPPHIRVLAQVTSIQKTITSIQYLGDIVSQVAAHISRQRQRPTPNSLLRTRVFIGHGRSPIWRELKDFLEDQLGLPIDEFDRVPAAGVSITGRLSAMLESTVIAFLVMTGEDEQLGGEFRPRENVVHEAGLFQGRLGFERAIVLLEEGCQKFSNNAGLVHIDFPRNNIRASFQDVRDVLEREGILNKGITT